jgi:hypothetical protein
MPAGTAPMMTDWMRVMLEEIERKRRDAEQAELERQRREPGEAPQPHAADPG